MMVNTFVAWLLALILGFFSALGGAYNTVSSGATVVQDPQATYEPVASQQPTDSALTEEEAWELVWQAYEVSDPEEAAALFAKAAQAETEDIDLLASCVDGLWSLGAYEGAEYALRRILDLGGEDLLFLRFTLAALLYEAGRPGDAEALVQETMAMRPDDLEFISLEAQILYQYADAELALQNVNARMEVYPDLTDLYRIKAWLLAEQWEYDAALDAVKQAINLESRQGTPIYDLQDQFALERQAGRFEQAQRTLDKLISATDDVGFWIDRVRLKLWDLYLPGSALEDLNALKNKFSDELYFLELRAYAHALLEEYDQAYAAADEIGDAAYAELMRGVTALYADDLDKATAHLDAYIAMVPDDISGQIYLAIRHLALENDPQAALKTLEQALLIASESANCYGLLGDTYARLGRGQDALDAYRKAIALAEESAGYYGDLIRCLAAWDRWDEAQAALAETELRNPNWYDTLAVRVDYELAAANYEAALAAYEKLEEKYPAKGEEHATVKASILCALGRMEEGLALFESIERDDAYYHNDYGYALILAGQYEQAEAELAEGFASMETSSASPGTQRGQRLMLTLTQAELAYVQGETQGALELLGQACDMGWRPIEAKTYPLIAAIWEDPGFQALLEKYPLE